jgi:hypothetical protein
MGLAYHPLYLYLPTRMASRKIVLYILFVIVLSSAAYVAFVVIPQRILHRSYEGAKRLGKDIQQAFNFTPEIVVSKTVVLQQQAATLELATLIQRFQHKYEWKNTWLGSTKEITISGSMEAKIGFNLNKRFAIEIDKKKAVVILPEPELLSVEPQGDIKFEDENGVWNWVKNEDRSNAINAFQLDARTYATRANFATETKTMVEQKLTKILKAHVEAVEFRYEEPDTTSNSPHDVM